MMMPTLGQFLENKEVWCVPCGGYRPMEGLQLQGDADHPARWSYEMRCGNCKAIVTKVRFGAR